VTKDLIHLLALTLIDGIGPVTGRNLISHCGSAESVFRERSRSLLSIPGVGWKVVELVRGAKTHARAESELEYCNKNGIQIISYDKQKYPEILKSIFDAPLVLFVKGNIDFNQQPSVAIVGTRMPGDAGRQTTKEFARFFAERNVAVIAGLAYGVDIIAHETCLQSGGKTVAVLGHGLDQVYPSFHRTIAGRMLESGALVSYFVSGTRPEACNFPARNRIISGLSKAVIVIEARKTGGALITAKFGFEQNREIYAVPGDIRSQNSAGCNQLIRDNIAKLITHPSEVMVDLGLIDSEAGKPSNGEIKNHFRGEKFAEIPYALSSDERKILTSLSSGPSGLDSLSLKSGIPLRDLLSLLLGLEFKGAVKQLPGKVFRRL